MGRRQEDIAIKKQNLNSIQAEILYSLHLTKIQLKLLILGETRNWKSSNTSKQNTIISGTKPLSSLMNLQSIEKKFVHVNVIIE